MKIIVILGIGLLSSLLLGCRESSDLKAKLKIISVEKITNKGGTSPSWSSQGELAFISNNNIWIVNPTYPKYTRKVDVEKKEYRQLAFSPDGSKLLLAWEPNSGDPKKDYVYDFRRVYGISIMDIRGSWTKVFLESGGSDPAWSFDSRKVVFAEYLPNYATLGIKLVDIYGTQELVIPKDIELSHDYYPSFSPDNKKVVYVRYYIWKELYKIMVYNTESGDVRSLITSKNELYKPVYSPDGRRIAFTSAGFLMIMDSDGSNCLQLTSNKLGTVKSGPSWSLDGKKIACVMSTFGDPYENIWILNLKEE